MHWMVVIYSEVSVISLSNNVSLPRTLYSLSLSRERSVAWKKKGHNWSSYWCNEKLTGGTPNIISVVGMCRCEGIDSTGSLVSHRVEKSTSFSLEEGIINGNVATA